MKYLEMEPQYFHELCDKFRSPHLWGKDENGEWMLDVKNPDEKLKSRKKLGMTVMQNLVWDVKEKEWNDGKIYDAREGDTYSLYAKTDGKDTLNLRGYIGFALFGKTTSWTRSIRK